MACSQTLAGLARDCSPSIGGVKTVYIANYDDVDTISVTTGIISAITMLNSAKFKKYYIRRGAGSMTSTLNVDATSGSNYVSTEVALQFSRMETTKRLEMTALSQDEVAIIVEDMNGVFWYLGKDEPVLASAGTGETGTARSDANQYTLTFTDNSLTFPHEVDDTAVASVIA